MSFYESVRLEFIKGLDDKVDSFEYLAVDHLRMSAIFWALTTLHLLKGDDWEEFSPLPRKQIISFVLECQNEDGGFGGNGNMESHILFTLSAIQILYMLKDLSLIDTDSVVKYIVGLQQPDGSFQGDIYGEVDTRFSYAAIATLRLLGSMDLLNMENTISYIMSCQNPDGGFGAVPGGESHAGQSNSFNLIVL